MKRFLINGVEYECDDEVNWVAQDKESGSYFGYEEKPCLGSDAWDYPKVGLMYKTYLVGDSWKESLIKV